MIKNLDFQGPEEDQTALAGKSADALRQAGYQGGARIDEASLVARDQVDACNKALRTGNYQTENYPSNIGFYGFQVKHRENESVYSQGRWDRPIMRLEKFFYRKRDSGSYFGRSLREKISGSGLAKDMEKQIRELGLDQYFYIDDHGRVIEKTGDIKKGIILDDLMRLGARAEPEYTFLRKHYAESQNALALCARTLNDIHQKSKRGVGEALLNDFVLQVEDDRIVGARITLPDVKYADRVDALEQQATDLIDLCFSAGSAGFQTGKEEQANENISTVLNGYQDELVKVAVLNLVPARPAYGYFTNRPRLGFDRVKEPEKAFQRVREIIISNLKQTPKALPERTTP